MTLIFLIASIAFLIEGIVDLYHSISVQEKFLGVAWIASSIVSMFLLFNF